MPGAGGRPGLRAEAAKTRRAYDLVAGDYAAAISDELAGKPFDRALLDAIVELAAGSAIADVGCGPGHVTRCLADRGARVVLGLDKPAIRAASRARAVARRVRRVGHQAVGHRAESFWLPPIGSKVAHRLCFRNRARRGIRGSVRPTAGGVVGLRRQCASAVAARSW